MKKKKSELPENSNLPPELIEEVLARVAVKPLMKFRCVSKTWCSLIDSSDFISMHRRLYNNSVNTPLLLAIETRIRKGSSITVRRSDTFRKISNIGKLPKSCSILQTCNGLSLIESCDETNNYARVMMLWNPCIRKCLILPNPPPHDDPCRFSRDRYVLGFAPCSNDYKVLAFRRGYRVRIAVYSLNDHCWRVITNRTCVKDFVEPWPGSRKYYAFPGSSVYWVVRYEYAGETAVLCFDFDVEEFRSVQLPDAVKESSFWFIFALSGSIAVFTMSSENIRIWIMEKDGGEDPWRLWNLGESCSDACKLLQSVSKGFPCSDTMYVENSNTIFMVLIDFERTRKRTQDRLMSYNITTQKVQHLGKSIRGYISCDPYVESLVLHKGLEGQNLTSFP